MKIEDTKNISIVEYLKAIGVMPVVVKRNQYWYMAPYRSESRPSLKVNMDINMWYDFGTNDKGDLVELGKLLYQTNSVREVLDRISRQAEISSIPYSRPPIRKPHTTESEMTDIEVRELIHPALLSYMRSRHIDAVTAQQHCREVHYKVRNRPYFAIAFQNCAGGYELRNQYFKGCIRIKQITHLIESGTRRGHVCVFEGFMDFLSYVVLKNKGDTNICIDAPVAYIILNSVSNRDKAEVQLDFYKNIHCYLDNDLAGRLTTEALAKKFGTRVIDESSRYDEYCDLNDYLRGKKH